MHYQQERPENVNLIGIFVSELRCYENEVGIYVCCIYCCVQ